MIPCVSQVCTLANSFEEDVQSYSDAGVTHVEIWLTKLEQYLSSHTLADAIRLLENSNLRVPAAAQHGGLLLSQGEARRVAFEHFGQRLRACQKIGIPTLILQADFTARPGEADMARAIVSLTQAAQQAADHDVRLALEFRGADSFCNNLETCVLLLEQCGEKNLGICLDAYHYMKGPSKPEDLSRLTAANLFHVQLCDVAGKPRELMADPDRVFPGEGDFHLGPIMNCLRAINYGGAVSLEIMNPQLWKVKASQVVELGMAALKKIIDEKN